MLKFERLGGALRLPFNGQRARRADGSFVDRLVHAAVHGRLAYDVPAAVVYF